MSLLTIKNKILALNRFINLRIHICVMYDCTVGQKLLMMSHFGIYFFKVVELFLHKVPLNKGLRFFCFFLVMSKWWNWTLPLKFMWLQDSNNDCWTPRFTWLQIFAESNFLLQYGRSVLMGTLLSIKLLYLCQWRWKLIISNNSKQLSTQLMDIQKQSSFEVNMTLQVIWSCLLKM